MPRITVSIIFTPEEFRKTLPKELREIFDLLVEKLVEFGVDEKSAKLLVAREINKALKQESQDEGPQGS